VPIRGCERCGNPTPTSRHRFCGPCGFVRFVERERRRGKHNSIEGFRAEYEARKRRPASQGYGQDHQRLRAQWAQRVDAGEVSCARCARRIAPGTPWHLDHDDRDRSRYLGASHQRCNTATASHRAKRTKRPIRRQDEGQVRSRQW
jgi:hypothetical protein